MTPGKCIGHLRRSYDGLYKDLLQKSKSAISMGLYYLVHMHVDSCGRQISSPLGGGMGSFLLLHCGVFVVPFIDICISYL